MSSELPPFENSVFDYKSGLRKIALFEVAKGLTVFFGGMGLWFFLDENLETAGARLLDFLHIDPKLRYSQKFLEFLSGLAPEHLIFLAVGIVVYTAIRFVEAYGLWYAKNWAQWLTIISCALYLPIEIYELFKEVTILRLTIFLLNVAIILFIFWGMKGATIFFIRRADKKDRGTL